LDLTSEAIVRRYSRVRPGYKLVWYDKVAIPVYVLRLRALVLEAKPLAAVDEFLLAGIEAGLSELEELSGFLGLSERLVRKLVGRLLSSDLVVVANLNHSRVTLSLTTAGEKVLREAKEIVSEEEEITVVIDGLTRQIEDARIGSDSRSYAIWSDVAKAGIRELPSNPRTQPELEDFVEDLKRKWNNDAGKDCSLIDVLKIVRVDRLFRDDVLLLGFLGLDSDASLSALAVAGHLSPAHTEAFQRIDEKSLTPITALQGHSLEVFAQENLPSEVFQMLADHGFSEGSSLDTASSDARQTALETRLQATSSVVERSTLEEELLSEKERQAELLARAESLPVRSISVFEHPALLEEALNRAKDRLLIISPWIRGAIVDSAFTNKLQNALDRIRFKVRRP